MTTTHLVGGQSTSLDDPTDLTRADYIAAFKRTLAEVKGDDVPGLAAGVAFKIFLSIFPSLFAAVAVFSIVTTPADLADMLERAGTFLPPAAIELLAQPLRDLASGGGGAAGFAAILGIATGLYAATSAAISLMKALSRAYDVAETRKFVKQRLTGLALIVALVVALVAIVLLLVVGPQIQDVLLSELVAPITWVLAVGRFALAVAVLILLFAFVYWMGPNRDHPSWVWMSPGALFGVIGWLVVSGGFTLYAQTAGSYEKTYGAIAGVVVLLVWLQLSMLVILVGAEFNAEVERARSLHLAVDEGSGFSAPGAAGAVLPDQAAGEAAVQQTQTGAHSLDPSLAYDPDDTVDVAPPVPAQPVPAAADPADPSLTTGAPATMSSQTRKAGAAVAALMAAAVFLGFARRHKRG